MEIQWTISNILRDFFLKAHDQSSQESQTQTSILSWNNLWADLYDTIGSNLKLASKQAAFCFNFWKKSKIIHFSAQKY